MAFPHKKAILRLKVNHYTVNKQILKNLIKQNTNDWQLRGILGRFEVSMNNLESMQVCHSAGDLLGPVAEQRWRKQLAVM